MSFRKSLIIPLLLVVFPCSVYAAGAVDVLKRARDADKHVSYRGLKTATIRYSGGTTTSSIKVVHLKPDRTRTEYFTPDALAGTIVIENGTDILRYHPKEQVWERMCPQFVLPTDVIQQGALENYWIRLIGSDLVAGRPAYVVHAVPKRRGEAARRIWVDKQFYLIVGTQVENAQGTVVNSSRYTEIDFDPRDISPSIFKVTGRIESPPAKADEAFKIAKPAYLPKGYRMIGLSWMRVNTFSCVHLQFSNGANTISLFERMIGAKKAPPVVESKFINVLTWKQDNKLFTLIGNISKDELQKIADSVK